MRGRGECVLGCSLLDHDGLILRSVSNCLSYAALLLGIHTEDMENLKVSGLSWT